MDCTCHCDVTILGILPRGFADCFNFFPTFAYALSANRLWTCCPRCNPQDNVARANLKSGICPELFSGVDILTGIDDVYTCDHDFVGMKSLVSYVYGMKTDNQFVNTLWDNISSEGATIKLISDCDQSEGRNLAQIILRALVIDDWQIKNIIITITFLNITIRQLSDSSITLLNVQVPLTMRVLYPPCMRAYSLTINMLLTLRVYK